MCRLRWIAIHHGGICLAMSWLGVALFVFSGSGLAQTPRTTPDPPSDPVEAERLVQLGSRSLRVHDPSTIIRRKDEYWITPGEGFRQLAQKTWSIGNRVRRSSRKPEIKPPNE